MLFRSGLAGQRSDSLAGTGGAPSPPATYPKPPPASSSASSLPRPPPTTQAGYRQAPGPPPRDNVGADASATGNAGANRGAASASGSRPNLTPGRAAPAVPVAAASALTKEALAAGQPQSGLKPLLTSSASRTNLKDPAAHSARTPAQGSHSKANVGQASAGQKPLQLASASKPTGDLGSSTSSKAAAGPKAPPPPLKKAEKTEGDRRISTMSEAQIMTKLRSVCSPQDPNTMYSKIKKVGQGASGSVYVAKVLASGAKVAIKQMDLSHQPRKELIVNEILVMKESQHPNIVNFLDSFLVKGAELWVVMEFMEGGALTDVIDSNSLEEDQISSISNEVRTGPVPACLEED